MKYIIIGVALLGLLFRFSIRTSGQTEVTLDSDTIDNDSFVNVAYRSVEKNDLANAISVLNPSEYLDNHYGTYPLEGVSAFVGGDNLWGIGDELVLIDGIPRSIDDVILSEIEQITFLKGVNAFVLYGSRAANGVISITTKRGKIGNRVSNVRVNAGINVPKAYPEYLGSSEYMTYYNQALQNDGLDPLYDDETISNYAAQSNPYRYPDVDYYSSDYLRKMYNTFSANADFSGGNERARFFALVGMERQNSLLNFGEGTNEGITRLNVRGNIDLDLNDFIHTYVNISTVFEDDRTASGDYWEQAATLHPHRFPALIPIDMIDESAEDALNLVNTSDHIIDGKYLLGGTQEYLTNPIGDVYAEGYRTNTDRLFQYSAGIDIDLNKALQGLSFHGQMGIDYTNRYRQYIEETYAVYVPEWDENSDIITGLAKYNKDSSTGTQNLSDQWNHQVLDFNVHFDYERELNEKHNISAMLIAAGNRVRQTEDFQSTTNANLGLQFCYNYTHRYYVDFSGAIVNSTKLPKDTRVAFSPTFSLSWVLSEEDFLKSSSIIDRLKFSVSGGIINSDLDFESYYMYDGVYASTAYFSWGDGENYTNQATTLSRGENLNLGYAKRKEINFGVDGLFFDRKLNFNANVFFIKKEGLPVQRYTQYPSFFYTNWPETSFVPYSNYEENSYRGFDFQLDYNTNVGEVDLILGVSGTYVATEALKRDELYADSYRNRVGNPVDAIFGLKSEGLFVDAADIDNHEFQKFGEVNPGDIKYKNQNGDDVIDERDEVRLGQWSSPFTGGLHVTAKWKDFSLFVLGTGSFGGTGVKSNEYYWVYGDRKYSEEVRNSWTEETRNTATYPRLSTLNSNNNFRYSDFWIYSTDRIDIAKVQLTYTLPKSIIAGSFIKDLNVYVSGSNLLTISQNKDIMELNIGSTPYTRFYNFGIRAVF
jgi:TonB-linked SusC/RagA family outer membrane protein